MHIHIPLNMFNEKYQKLVSLCNQLRNDDVIVQYDTKCLNKMEKLLKLLSYILDTELLWLYLYRLYSLKQSDEECNSNQFTILTDNYVHLENDILLNNDRVISVQSIEYEDNELIQINCINLQCFIEIVHSKWDLWLILKNDLYEHVSMFEKSIDEMCEVSNDLIELLSNWSIPYCDYAAPLKCSVEDFTDQKQNSYQSSLDTNYGLVNLNKWIKRLFPYLLDCVIIWCKAEKCWKITGVINEFHQHIELLDSLKWIPSINQWFTQFYSTLQLTFLRMTLNSLLNAERNHKWINESIRKKQLIPVIILELTIRLMNWQKLEKIIIKEDRRDEFDKIM
ncbi:uncharacterized protein DC041_0010891 [Schistosoma bovis]|uniref:Uncharacterized protein n=1 Tax=Schistosoma bovis TaxID=6184 RepID=A0A430Q5D5_SCHBO|nr:uncharacterized protein DC041_0010891 [Schistosoma bovis]